MQIGVKLKQGRLQRNLTQENVANILNVSRATISSWEVGRTYPDLDSIVALSDLYNFSLDELLREDTNMVKKISNDSKIAKNLIEKGKYIGILLIVLLFSIGSILFINYRKHLHVELYSNKLNTYEITVKGSKKYYDINDLDLNSNDSENKVIELKNYNNKISIYNNAKDKFFDIKILDSTKNKTIDKIDGLYPNTSWEGNLDDGDYYILLKSNEYNRN